MRVFAATTGDFPEIVVTFKTGGREISAAARYKTALGLTDDFLDRQESCGSWILAACSRQRYQDFTAISAPSGVINCRERPRPSSATVSLDGRTWGAEEQIDGASAQAAAVAAMMVEAAGFAVRLTAGSEGVLQGTLVVTGQVQPQAPGVVCSVCTTGKTNPEKYVDLLGHSSDAENSEAGRLVLVVPKENQPAFAPLLQQGLVKALRGVTTLPEIFAVIVEEMDQGYQRLAQGWEEMRSWPVEWKNLPSVSKSLGVSEEALHRYLAAPDKEMRKLAAIATPEAVLRAAWERAESPIDPTMAPGPRFDELCLRAAAGHYLGTCLWTHPECFGLGWQVRQDQLTALWVTDLECIPATLMLEVLEGEGVPARFSQEESNAQAWPCGDDFAQSMRWAWTAALKAADTRLGMAGRDIGRWARWRIEMPSGIEKRRLGGSSASGQAARGWYHALAGGHADPSVLALCGFGTGGVTCPLMVSGDIQKTARAILKAAAAASIDTIMVADQELALSQNGEPTLSGELNRLASEDGIVRVQALGV